MIHWLEPVTYLASSLLFVFLLTHVHEIRRVSGGIFYGILVGLLVSGVHAFGQYATYPIPFILAVLWFAEGLVQYTIAGIITSLIYRPKIQPNS
jgi:energy-coupling factor transporter transmembrane protein EcfT